MRGDEGNDGWQRFLDRLRRLWGKLRGSGQVPTPTLGAYAVDGR